MDRDALALHLMRLFLGELEDHERTLENDLLALEREGDEAGRRALLESLFRAAHSLKGAARAVGAGGIESICHRLEHALSELRGASGSVEPARMQVLLGYLDGVKENAQRLRLDAGVMLSAQAPAAASSLPPPPLTTGPSPALPVPPAALSMPPPANDGAPSTSGAAEGATPAGVQPPRSGQSAAREPELRATRVATHKLDALLARSSDLVIATSRMEARLVQLSALRDRTQQLARTERRRLARTRGAASAEERDTCRGLAAIQRELERIDDRLREDVGTIASALRHVDDEVRRLRTVPFREATEGLERSVRDLAHTLGKEARITFEGAQVEMDRELVQRLRDPLLHLVRNAVSHGLERPDVRRTQGKAAGGQITVRATLRGSVVDLSVADDGRGLDFAAIRQRARALGWPEVADEEELSAYVFAPGFSTADTVNEIAGRGVGLDAVKRGVEALHGSVSVSSRFGYGAHFTMRLPLTLSKLRCLFVRVGGHPYAIPTSHGVRVLRFDAEHTLRVGGNEQVRAGDELVPVVPLAPLLGMQAAPPRASERAEALVVSTLGRSVALLVDALLDERERIVHKLPPRLAGARYVSGATMLSLGQIAPVLNGSELGQAAVQSLARSSVPVFAQRRPQRKRVLVADDSVTTRALIKNIVEEGGYEVVAARDGSEALRLLQEQAFDLVVSDVQMPNMDGFTLTEQIRGIPKLARTPVILVTSLEGERDRLRGLEAGASAYLGKSAFDHRVLLETIGGLV